MLVSINRMGLMPVSDNEIMMVVLGIIAVPLMSCGFSLYCLTFSIREISANKNLSPVGKWERRRCYRQRLGFPISY